MSYQHKVQYYETDRMGITHHSNYIRIMEEARGEWMEQMGMSYDTFESLGLSSPVVNVSCNYKKPTTYNDCIEVNIFIIDCDHLKMRLAYEMTSKGDTVATATSVHCFLEKDGRPISLKRRFPEVHAAYKAYEAQQGPIPFKVG